MPERAWNRSFIHVDAGDDQLMNRIIWYALKGKEAYPKQFSGKDDDEEDEDD